ncbi:DNA adenine methylase [Candidatus Palauibacter sp.]|uniref:DNA adenine methylase n=1 Tax=Candidatus Palauibacter sp. TaxID=3101350 RepID=UPI003B52ED64
MRYIGNKTKLLSFIASYLDELELHGGRALDAFTGTTAVARLLKARGFTVDTCDIMSFSYVLQRACVVADEYPQFPGLAEDSDLQAAKLSPHFRTLVESRLRGQGDLFSGIPDLQPLEEALVYLDTYLDPLSSFIDRHFAASESPVDGQRMYFSRRNAQRIDAIRHRLHDWRSDGLVTEEEFYILLTALLEAADSVANTAGVYAAFVKTWQSNATRPLRLNAPDIVVGTGLQCSAHRGDVVELVADLGRLDLLYLDPPYNTRQYSAYYHVPELIAEGWFAPELPTLRGKTGLIDDSQKKSEWSTRAGCIPALEQLLRAVDATHVLLSYNNEGIIPDTEIERCFRQYGVSSTYRRTERTYKRYRADRDSDARQYSGDHVTEFLYYVRLR